MNSIAHQAFFELLQVALGTRGKMSIVPNAKQWAFILEEAQRQAVVGVMVDGLERLSNNQRPPKDLLLQWIGLEQIMGQTYELHYERARELISSFRACGFNCCLLKGVGLAQLYPNPQRRQLGDIDLWVRLGGEKPIKKTIEYLLSNYNLDKQKIVYHHADVPIFNDAEVEVHWRPSWRSLPLYNRRLQKWFDEHAAIQFGTIEKAGLKIPTWDFNVIYLLQHMYMHIFMEGIGLRQFVDYYYLLMSEDRNPNEGIITSLKYLGLYDFAGAVMYIMQEVFAMDKKYLLMRVDAKRGEFLLQDIMQSGNFGHYDERNKEYFQKSGVSKIWAKIKKQSRFMRDYPSEALGAPFRIYHVMWRWLKLWRWE